ncbi:MAG TPA: flagellar hook-basal body protein [Gammaproteobacteria bacterium]|nr:flagellar hook-basal body protein [Gammaproteobacteria bacterium]
MSDAITAIAQYMRLDLERLRAVSENVANTQTTGYRALLLEAVAQPAGEGDSVTGPAVRSFYSTADGALTTTGQSLDFALSGNAWFAVLSPDGVRYTRDGAFHLDADGRLLTAMGLPVLGRSGPIVLSNASVTADARGVISYGDRPVAQLRIVALPSQSALHLAGPNLYRFAAAPANDYVVRQGALETSNVNQSDEMVRMIGISRHIESIQRAVVAYDRMLGSAINQLGK